MSLAKATGISQSAIAKWELNKTEPAASALIILAKFFGETTDFLLGLENWRAVYPTLPYPFWKSTETGAFYFIAQENDDSPLTREIDYSIMNVHDLGANAMNDFYTQRQFDIFPKEEVELIASRAEILMKQYVLLKA